MPENKFEVGDLVRINESDAATLEALTYRGRIVEVIPVVRYDYVVRWDGVLMDEAEESCLIKVN